MTLADAPRTREEGRRTTDGKRWSVVRRPRSSVLGLPSVVALVFALALVVRLIAHDVVITADEDNWMRRAGGFTYGLLNGRLGRTYQNGHPGVTTMWVAMLALGPDRMVRYADPVHQQRSMGRVPGFWDALVDARVGFAVATAALVTLSCGLTWRLFGPGPGVLAGLLVGLEPFYLGISQLVHMDAILSGCMVLSVLSALVGWEYAGGSRTPSEGAARRGWLALSGVFAGLALLSKSPALFLLLFVPLLGVCKLPPKRSPTGEPSPQPSSGRRGGQSPLSLWERAGLRASRQGRARTLALDFGVWFGLALATVLLLWPAIWALGPWEVLGRVAAFTRETGGRPHEAGTYFWGQPRTDPGPFFYPVALLFRLAPLTLLGLVLLVALRGRVAPERLRAVVALGAYCLGFLAVMTLGAKKFDRYLLPIFPALEVLAALGIWQALAWLAGSSPRRPEDPALGPGARGGETVSLPRALGPGVGSAPRKAKDWRLLAGVVVAASLLLWPLVSSYPYFLAFYNPLLGGGAAAQRTVMVGNGEGLDQVAGWLNAQPNAENLWVASHSFDILEPLIRGSGEPLRERVPPEADYVVLYRFQLQVGDRPRVREYVEPREPELSVRIDGIEYAQVYRGPHLEARAAAGSP